jgi:ankyrin repeat protein
MAKLLLSNGTYVNVRNNRGRTALDTARMREYTNIITLLKQAGAH